MDVVKFTGSKEVVRFDHGSWACSAGFKGQVTLARPAALCPANSFAIVGRWKNAMID